MSSVSKTNRSRNTDEVRDLREHYQTRESDAAKKKAKELAALRKKHNEEVKALTEQFDKRVADIREKSSETMSERDSENQEQVEQIRKLYMDQARRKAEQAESEKKDTRRTYESQIEKDKAITQLQKDVMERNFRDSLAEKDRQLADTSQRGIENLRDQLEERTGKIRSKFERDSELSRQNQDEQMLDLSNDNLELKSRTRNEIADMKRRHAYEKDQMERNFFRTRSQENRNYSKLLDDKNSDLKAERERMAEQLGNKMADKKRNIEEANQKFREEVTDRVDGELRQARYEVDELKKSRHADRTQDRRMRDMERRNLQDTYEARYKDLEGQRNNIYDVVNAKAQERMGREHERNEKMMANQYRDFKTQISLKTTQAQEDRSQMLQQHDNEVEYLTNRADKRLRQVRKNERANLETQTRYFQANVGQLKEDYANRLLEMRERQMQEVQALNQRLDSKFRKATSDLGKQLEETKTENDLLVQEMRGRHQEEVLRLGKIHEQRAKDREKAVRIEQKSIENKYESRLAQQESIHRAEMERIEKRHQEQMAGLANRMNALNRKA